MILKGFSSSIFLKVFDSLGLGGLLANFTLKVFTYLGYGLLAFIGFFYTDESVHDFFNLAGDNPLLTGVSVLYVDDLRSFIIYSAIFDALFIY